MATGLLTAQSDAATPSVMAAPDAGGLSLGVKIGLGAAIPIAVVMTALIAFFIVRRRRAARQADHAVYPELQSQPKSEAHPTEVDGTGKPCEVDGQSRVEMEEQTVYELSATEQPREQPPLYPGTRSFYDEAEA